jgi:deazaflavin-dependent oxidoreductase (nitroreductase family)
MSDEQQPAYLYLTTTGRLTGNPHEIEIWFVEYAGNYYLVSEYPDRADWVKNISHNPAVKFRVGNRSAESIPGTGRMVDRAAEPELAAAVSRLMDAKYDWSSGQIVELKPAQ